MNRNAILALVCVLFLILLTACGSTNTDTPDVSQPGDSSSVQPSAPDISQPGDSSSTDPSTPDISTPDESKPDDSQPGDNSSVQPIPETTLTLNKSDFTLMSAGASYKLKYTAEPVIEGTAPRFSSSDEAIATVANDGTVTAVALGTTTVTLTYGDLTTQCIVRCKWEETTQNPDDGSGEAVQPSDTVDLAAFYDNVCSNYKLSAFLQQADTELLDNLYPGLSTVKTEQCLVFATMMSMNMGEIALIQVKDGADVETVKTILQARIDVMVDGGAWYPEPTRIWSECSNVVSNGNYIMMVVNEEYQAIVDDFNALF